MAGNDEDRALQPGDDPYEFDWPDDSKEMRAAERAKASARSVVTPAPRSLTAIVIGLTVVFLFLVPIGLVVGDMRVLTVAAAPIALAGLVLGFPLAAMLERVSRTWRTGLSEVATLLLGVATGYGWTFAFITYLPADVFGSEEDFFFIRSVSSIFMATATASAFMAAKFGTDRLRNFPQWVYGLGIAVGLIIILSVLQNFFLPTPV